MQADLKAVYSPLKVALHRLKQRHLHCTQVPTSDSEAVTPQAREIEDARHTLRRSEPDLSVLVEQASLEGELAPPEASGQDSTSLAGQRDVPASAKQQDEDHPVDEEERQKQLDEHFGGGPQVPPLKLGVLILLTAGAVSLLSHEPTQAIQHLSTSVGLLGSPCAWRCSLRAWCGWV